MRDLSTVGRGVAVAAACLAACASTAAAADWSTTELMVKRGRLAVPGFAGGGHADTTILTLQHASGWKYGDNFFFVDLLNDHREDGFNDTDAYAELYCSLSASRISGTTVGFGPVRDVALLVGLNWAADPKVRKYLPGVRLSWEIPGFAFLNSDIMAYLDDSPGIGGGGAPAESDAFMVDVNWAYPFSLGRHRFSVEGHVEYVARRSDELGQPVSDWILGQPQLRFDLGNAVLHVEDTLFVGIEWQFWLNKLGDASTDENAVQALLVWRF